MVVLGGRFSRVAAFVLAGAFLAACSPAAPSGGSTGASTAATSAPAATTAPAATSAPAAKASSAASAAPAASSAPASAAGGSIDKTPIKMSGNSAPDQGYVPLLMAMDDLKQQGYNVQPFVQFNSDTLNTQAVVSNQAQFSSSSLNTVATAVSKNLPIRVLGARGNNVWTLVSTTDITDCNQLTGKNVGIFSEQGVSTAELKIYFQQYCPNVKPTYLVIADSNLRAQALAAGKLVATPLEPDGAISLTTQHPDKFHVLANFGQSMPDIARDVVWTNTTMIQQHPTIVQAFVDAYIKDIRSIYANPSSLVQLDQKYLKDAGSSAPQLAKFYLDAKAYCANGGLGDQNIAHTLEVFGSQYKLIPTGLTPQQLEAPSFMNNTLQKLGKSSATSC